MNTQDRALYAQHIRDCNALAQSGPDGCRRMVSFVLATIQQQLETVPDILRSFDTEGYGSRFAFGAKAAGLNWLDSHGAQLYADAMAAKHDDVELLLVFLRVPGLGLVKAGFAAQLFACRVGCLDVHNIRMYGINPAVLRVSKKAKPETLRKHAERYVQLCYKLGGPVELWAAWCEYKASLAPKNWADGADVSLLHVECLARAYRYTAPDLFSGLDYRPRYESGESE